VQKISLIGKSILTLTVKHKNISGKRNDVNCSDTAAHLELNFPSPFLTSKEMKSYIFILFMATFRGQICWLGYNQALLPEGKLGWMIFFLRHNVERLRHLHLT